jgi:hypothetical protein
MENQAPVSPTTGRTILRWIKNIILTVVALICAAIAYAVVQNMLYQQALANVTVQLDHTGKSCDPQFPLAVWVRNSSSKVVELTYIEIAARRPGYSSDLVAYGSKMKTWDKIIRPGAVEGVLQAFDAEGRITAIGRRLRSESP